MNERPTQNKTVEEFHVGSRPVGKGERCFIIAEAGVSHFGNNETPLSFPDRPTSNMELFDCFILGGSFIHLINAN
jgi:hypothetical protein